MSRGKLPEHVGRAVQAVREKKADQVVLLDMRGAASFTDYFLICTVYSPPQAKAVADEVSKGLSALGLSSAGREGGSETEWVLLDYLDLVVHIFHERARAFYDLERLWRTAKRVPLPQEDAVGAGGRG